MTESGSASPQPVGSPSLNNPYPGSSGTTPPSLGPLLHLRPLKASELPVHPDLASLQSSGSQPDLHAFIKDALAEASSFMTAYLPAKFTIKSESKPSPPSAAHVQLLSHEIPATAVAKAVPSSGAGSAEAWFARTSLHKDLKEQGTADWAEFEFGLLDEHSQHEMDYTPEVYDAYKVLSWDPEVGKIEGWEKVGLSIYEMAHQMPPPLNNRVFPVVIVTARFTATSPSLLVVQIPVDISQVPSALYSNGKHKQIGDTAQKKKDITLGQYVSIERAELLQDGPEVRWQMATASDAKGNVPMWAQKMGVPGAIVKDVGFLIDWTNKRRQGN